MRATCDGQVTLVKVFPGQNVRPGEQVLELTDMSTLRAQVKVPAKDRKLLFVGDKVEIRPGKIQAAGVPRANTVRPARGGGLFDEVAGESNSNVPAEAPAAEVKPAEAAPAAKP